MILRTIVKKGWYQDSVALMRLSRDLGALPGVDLASAMMGTPHNKALLLEAGLLDAEGRAASANDLIVAVRATSEQAAGRALDEAALRLAAPTGSGPGAAAERRPRTLEAATRMLPGANLVLISVPGMYAAAEAMKALRLGRHVLLFSDNVSVGDEKRLKTFARRQGLLLMGPDCGTAIIDGVPLGFANAVPRGRIGIAAASGTGLQQVSCLIASAGEGISQAIGLGGRDLSEEVGGLMMEPAIDRLVADAGTEVLVLISKPAAPPVLARLVDRLRHTAKPTVICFLGGRPPAGLPAHVRFVPTLEEGAAAAVTLLRGTPPTPAPFGVPLEEAAELARQQAARLGPAQTGVRGLFAGGTLAQEALLILEPHLGPIASNLRTGAIPAAIHRVLDLGADEFTVGRPHPMIDGAIRRDLLVKEALDPSTGVLLLDVILGHGAHPDPAGELVPAIRRARDEARAGGRDLCVVGSVMGTPNDPQGYHDQVQRLETAGVLLLPSNAQAARMAALIVSRGACLAALRGGDR